VTPPFRTVERGLDTDKELAGKQIYFALYSEGMLNEAKLLVNPEMAKMIDCGKPLEDMIASFRAAILDSARAHGNMTAQVRS
jgi:hypothetical protein